MTCQGLAGEVEPRDAPWSCRAARDAVPPTGVRGGVPSTQGSISIAGDALLELEQRVQIYAVLFS